MRGEVGGGNSFRAEEKHGHQWWDLPKAVYCCDFRWKLLTSPMTAKGQVYIQIS